MKRISSKRTSAAPKKVFLHGILGSGLLLCSLTGLSFIVFTSLEKKSGFALTLPSWAESVQDKTPETPKAVLRDKPRAQEEPSHSTAGAVRSMALVEVTRGLEADPQAARDALKKYLHEHPGDPDTLFQIALLEGRRLQNPEAALPYLFEAMAADRTNPIFAHEALHAIMSSKTSHDEQVETLNKFAALEGANGEDLKYPLAQAYLSLGEKDRAFEQIEQAVQAAPEEQAGLYEDAAQLSFEKGSYERALSLIDRALDQQSGEKKEFFTLVKKVQILAALERRDELQDLFQELSAQTQGNPQHEKIIVDLKQRHKS